MGIRVDTTKCAGIGVCEMVAAEVFEIGDTGQSHVLDPDPVGERLTAAQEAVASCPTGALSID
jgi:ferredoxin